VILCNIDMVVDLGIVVLSIVVLVTICVQGPGRKVGGVLSLVVLAIDVVPYG
jgi:hypothetical protein